VCYVEGETWARLFENRVLRNMFGPKSGDVRRYWMKLLNEETLDLLSSPNITQLIKLDKQVIVREEVGTAF
jgi:hypothetical protein